MNNNNGGPLHIRPKWQKVAARLQHEARKNEGYAIISIKGILIDENGDPVLWTEPSMTKLEPKGLCSVLSALGIDENAKI